jgi:hypothetical protein
MWQPLKKTSLSLGLVAMMLGQSACSSTSRAVAPSRCLPQPEGILRLAAGQTYQAGDGETWYSARKYQALEVQLIDALGALKQAQNR